MSGEYKPGHKPAGPGGGQFTHPERQEAAIGVGGLRVNPAAEEDFPDQVASIREAGLQGSVTRTPKGLAYTTEDGREFEVHQDGHTTPDGDLGWAVDNHDVADVDDPSYGLRYETITQALGETLAEAAFTSAAARAFTLNEGSETYDFRAHSVDHSDGKVVVNAGYTDVETNDELDVYFDVDDKKLTVYYDGSEATGPEADEVLQELVDYNAHGFDVPDGSPSQKMAWHMERSFRIAAANDGSPKWAHDYRVDGLTWNDRH
jgi:hypothetical protein